MTDILDEFAMNLEGYIVDSRKLDRFYNGSDGSRVSDEQWDEEKKRYQSATLEGLPVQITLPTGDEFGAGGA